MNLQHIITILILSVGIACQSNTEAPHNHGPNGHTHGPSRPRTDNTIWTEKSELFVEYPVLVVGKPSRFAAHFTMMEGHQPIETGSVTATLSNSTDEQRVTAAKPSSSGIFKPTIQPKKAGIYTLIFDVNTPTFKDQIRIPNVQVFQTIKEARKAFKSGGEDEGIIFLKEQAWKMEFQTAQAKQQPISDVIKTYGTWQTLPSDKKRLVATTKGLINFNGNNLTKGSPIKKGQVLMTIHSKGLTTDNLNTRIQNAKVSYETLTQEYERKKTLFSKQIISKSAFEQIEKDYLIAKTNYETLKTGYSQKGKQVVAPFDGTIQHISSNNGNYVNEGDELVTITKSQSSLLEAYVSPSFVTSLNDIQDIWYQPQPNQWSSLKNSNGQLQSISQSVDSSQPLLTIYAKINEQINQPKGSFSEVQIALGDNTKGIVIPKEALLEDYGQYSVIVQTSGESFEHRPISVGRTNGNFIEILNGLQVNEVVVTKGAYQVKMASMSGQAPAHGHAH